MSVIGKGEGLPSIVALEEKMKKKLN